MADTTADTANYFIIRITIQLPVCAIFSCIRCVGRRCFFTILTGDLFRTTHGIHHEFNISIS